MFNTHKSIDVTQHKQNQGQKHDQLMHEMQKTSDKNSTSIYTEGSEEIRK
jgi:hypothetical protein